ncbi:MAG: hypothetical protein IJC27_05415 [Lentisphaeria bacterium]|nr:hypothetical protein [Lentisphaeria bacterium]
MKKLKVAGLLLIMAIGFINGYVAFNYAADHAEAKISQMKGEDDGTTGTITVEEVEKAEGEHYMPGTMRSVGEWTYDSLKRHYNKHKKEFPEYKSAGEYKVGSENFFIEPPQGTQIKIAPNGDRMYYHEKSNTFGVITKHGTPKTFFRPNKGKSYWKRQRGKLLVTRRQENSEPEKNQPPEK